MQRTSITIISICIKVSGYNFIEIATDAMLGRKTINPIKHLNFDHVGVKTSQFRTIVLRVPTRLRE